MSAASDPPQSMAGSAGMGDGAPDLAAAGSGAVGPVGAIAAPEVTQPKRPGVFGRLLRAGATSAVATVLSHGTYIALLAAAHANATLASALAFLVGASFNYFVGRRVTWGRTKRPHPVKETLPYLAVIAASGTLSVIVATVVQHIIGPMGLTDFQRTAVLEAANICSYGMSFIFKFGLLDRLVFRHHQA